MNTLLKSTLIICLTVLFGTGCQLTEKFETQAQTNHTNVKENGESVTSYATGMDKAALKTVTGLFGFDPDNQAYRDQVTLDFAADFNTSIELVELVYDKVAQDRYFRESSFLNDIKIGVQYQILKDELTSVQSSKPQIELAALFDKKYGGNKYTQWMEYVDGEDRIRANWTKTVGRM